MRMATIKTYYRQTTVQQRKLLFKTWEETGNVTWSCKKAKVSRGTFYNWRERYEKKGFAGLEKCKSKAPKKTRRVSKEIEEKVIEKRRKNPAWGKQRISDEMAKENEWEHVVSPNTVRRILEDAGLWKRKEEEKTAKKEECVCRHAERADQSYNVDLCYVPASHEREGKLPAVSGSSGRLQVENVQEESSEKTWPGRVFEDKTLTYEEAMKSFVERSNSEDIEVAPSGGVNEEPSEQEIRKAEKRALNQEADELRVERRQIRMTRQVEDDVWREMRAERKEAVDAYNALPKEEQKEEREAKQTADTQWKSLFAQRRSKLAERRVADQNWREKRASIKQRLFDLPLITSWVAILIIIDNCTRQCIKLPIFVNGQHVTSHMVVDELRPLLPHELQFLITDRGTHFTADEFKTLFDREDFLHVLIARHRPQSNGVAERFVRTTKEWLKDKSWSDERELDALLQQFLLEYNDRPHQGLPTPGLSPNEFARRL